MKKLGSLHRVLQSDSGSHDGWELCATADVRYDPASSTVLVELDSLVQRGDLRDGVDGFRQPWLPAKEVVTRRVPLRDARVVAKEVFRRWMRKVRSTIPSPAHHVGD